MQNICQHFQEGTQADVGDFVGYLWSYAKGTLFGGKCFHIHPNGRLEKREQVPLNMVFAPGDAVMTLDEIINHWPVKKGANTCMELQVH